MTHPVNVVRQLGIVRAMEHDVPVEDVPIHQTMPPAKLTQLNILLVLLIPVHLVQMDGYDNSFTYTRIVSGLGGRKHLCWT